MPWTLPLPDGCFERDYTGCTNVALRNLVAVDWNTPERFKRHMVAYLTENLLTGNQRQLLVAVMNRCLEEYHAELAALPDDWEPDDELVALVAADPEEPAP